MHRTTSSQQWLPCYVLPLLYSLTPLVNHHLNIPTIHTLPTTFPHLPHLSSHLFTSGHPRHTFNSFSPLHHPPHPSRKTYSNCPSFQHAIFLVPELQRSSTHPRPFLFYTRAHTSNLPNCPPPHLFLPKCVSSILPQPILCITQYCISTFPQKPHRVPTHCSRSSPPTHTHNGNFCNHQSFPVPYPRHPHHTFTPLKCNLYTSYPPTHVQPLSTQLQTRTPLHSRTFPTP